MRPLWYGHEHLLLLSRVKAGECVVGDELLLVDALELAEVAEEGVEGREVLVRGAAASVAELEQTHLEVVDLAEQLPVHVVQLAAHALRLPELAHQQFPLHHQLLVLIAQLLMLVLALLEDALQVIRHGDLQGHALPQVLHLGRLLLQRLLGLVEAALQHFVVQGFLLELAGGLRFKQLTLLQFELAQSQLVLEVPVGLELLHVLVVALSHPFQLVVHLHLQLVYLPPQLTLTHLQLLDLLSVRVYLQLVQVRVHSVLLGA